MNGFPEAIVPCPEYALQLRKIEDLNRLMSLVVNAKIHGWPILCYIRHPSTVSVINRYLGLELKPCNGG